MTNENVAKPDDQPALHSSGDSGNYLPTRPEAPHSSFTTDETPWCVWDWQLSETNQHFLDGFDPSYFDYLAEVHASALDGTNDQHAAVALRTSYHHAMETFFALLGAMLQAPDCTIGWFHKYTNQQLESLVSKITHRQPFKTKLKLKDCSWAGLGASVFAYVSLPDKTKEQWIKKEFGQLWARLADEFLSPPATEEYNSFKHGMRLRAGGFHLAVGIEATPGVACPPAQMHSLGGSHYGSSFCVAERFDGVEKCNIRLTQHSRNWSPDQFIARLKLLSMSMRNVLSFLKIILGADPETQQFVWPAEPLLFEACWEGGASVFESSFNLVLTKEDIAPRSKYQIVAVYGQPSE